MLAEAGAEVDPETRLREDPARALVEAVLATGTPVVRLRRAEPDRTTTPCRPP